MFHCSRGFHCSITIWTVLSKIESDSDKRHSASHRFGPASGYIARARDVASRYSQMAWLPKTDWPSSVTKVGTLSRGLSDVMS